MTLINIWMRSLCAGILGALMLNSYGCELNISYTSATATAVLSGIPSQQMPSFEERLSNLSGCQFILKNYPIARIWLLTQQHKLPIIFGAFQSKERDRNGIFFEIIPIPFYWVSLKNSPKVRHFNDVKQLSSLRVGYTRGAKYNVTFERFIQEHPNQVDPSINDQSILEKLQLGRISGGIVNQLTYDTLMKKLQGSDVQAIPLPDLGYIAAGIYLDPKAMNAEQFSRLSQALKQLQTEQYFQQLMAKRQPASPNVKPQSP